MVEGHTDDVPIQNEVLLDNWDLSVKRATSIVRILQNDFGVPPERMTAAGRSFSCARLQRRPVGRRVVRQAYYEISS